uniref:Uncharacterized protein n=1 Tax=Sipha flava TaxID=143950 RepID=A0A2S2QIC0_9HEMI
MLRNSITLQSHGAWKMRKRYGYSDGHSGRDGGRRMTTNDHCYSYIYRRNQKIRSNEREYCIIVVIDSIRLLVSDATHAPLPPPTGSFVSDTSTGKQLHG